MSNLMEYRGYVGSVEFNEKDGVFYGKVQGIRSLISYEGTNAAELISDFHGAIDDYLALCEEEGTAPEVAYKGSFNVRFKKRDNHRRAAIYALTHNQSLNSFVEEAVEDRLAAVEFSDVGIGDQGPDAGIIQGHGHSADFSGLHTYFQKN